MPQPAISLEDQIWVVLNGVQIGLTHDAGIGISAREIAARFGMYTASPVGPAEREWLLNQLCEAIRTEKDKTLVASALKDMIEADGSLTAEEQIVFNEIQAAIANVDIGVFDFVGRLLWNALQHRSVTMSKAPNREKHFEEFLRNKVYYEMQRRMDVGEIRLNIPDEYLRKLGTVGGMMARVAQGDNIVFEQETDEMLSIAGTGRGVMSILQTGWGLSREAATFVIDVAMLDVSKNFDYLRMSREFFDIATPAERANLLELLFAVANADGRISNDEFAEIRRIADYLLLSRNRVNEAYSKFVQ